MRVSAATLALCLAWSLGGCGDPTGASADLTPEPNDMAKELPDGFVMTGCSTVQDCDDNNPCTTDRCPPDRVCTHTAVDCTMLDDECNTGMCVEGDCEKMPAHEGMRCMEGSAAAGMCTGGVCVADPTCRVNTLALACLTNTTRSGTTGTTNRLANYTCTGTYPGSEEARIFKSTIDRRVTIKLTASATDLDLLVLEGKTCLGTATCVATSLTAGSGNEEITFDAKANVDYLVVVESQSLSSQSYTLTVECAGCVPEADILACNQSLFVGDTTVTGRAALSSYACGGGHTGPEVVYTLKQNERTSYRFTATGTAPYDPDLVVLATDTAGKCNPQSCLGRAATPGQTEALSFVGEAGTDYSLLVDSKGAGGAFQLAVECLPSCRTDNKLACTTNWAVGTTNGGLSTDAIDSWGACATGLTGNETIYLLDTAVLGLYHVELTSSDPTKTLRLIALEGTTTACDPMSACVASASTSGATPAALDLTVTDTLKRYWIAVDSAETANFEFELKLTSASCGAPSCGTATTSRPKVQTLSCVTNEEQRTRADSAWTNAVDAWSCNSNTTGPEIVYRVTHNATTAPVGTYTATLDQMNGNLDLVVWESASTTCTLGGACLTQSITAGTAAETVSFDVVSGRSYFIAVDGKNRARSDFRLTLSSPACPTAESCSSTGAPAMTCTAAAEVGRNDGPNSTDSTASWGPAGTECATGLTGRERVHSFNPGTGTSFRPGPYTVQLFGLQADLDLIVLETPGTATTCLPTLVCKGAGRNTGTSGESVTFTAISGRRYLFIVDGYAGAPSPYVLAITSGCP
jgi:hypothetical protein